MARVPGVHIPVEGLGDVEATALVARPSAWISVIMVDSPTMICPPFCSWNSVACLMALAVSGPAAARSWVGASSHQQLPTFVLPVAGASVARETLIALATAARHRQCHQGRQPNSSCQKGGQIMVGLSTMNHGYPGARPCDHAGPLRHRDLLLGYDAWERAHGASAGPTATAGAIRP